MTILCAASVSYGAMVLDDFQGSLGNTPPQTNLGAAIGIQNGNLAAGKGVWTADHDNQGSFIRDASGSDINPANNFITKTDGLHAKFSLHAVFTDTVTDPANPAKVYGWCSFGATFSGSGATAPYYDLTKMTGVLIKAKGTGAVHVSFNTKENATWAWGDFGSTILLDPTTMTDFLISASDLMPSLYSDGATKGKSWATDGAPKVNRIVFGLANAGDTAEITIKEIVLLGVNPADFGITSYTGPTYEEVTAISSPKANYAGVMNSLSCPAIFRPNSSFSVSTLSRSSLSIYDLSGTRIAVLNGNIGTKNIYWNGADASGALVANGTYLVEARMDGVTVSRRFQFVR